MTRGCAFPSLSCGPALLSSPSEWRRALHRANTSYGKRRCRLVASRGPWLRHGRPLELRESGVANESAARSAQFLLLIDGNGCFQVRVSCAVFGTQEQGKGRHTANAAWPAGFLRVRPSDLRVCSWPWWRSRQHPGCEPDSPAPVSESGVWWPPALARALHCVSPATSIT